MPDALQTPTSDQPPELFVILAPIVFSVAFFAWLTISSWARQRRMEREAFYRSELYRGLAERGELTMRDLSRMRAEDHARSLARQRAGLTLAGLTIATLGVGMLLAFLGNEEMEARRIGLLPLAVGVAILAHAWLVLGRLYRNVSSPSRSENDS